MPTDKRARQKEGKALRQAELEHWRKRRAFRRRVLLFGGVGVVVVGALYVVSLRADDEEDAASTTTTTTIPIGTTECPPAGGVDEPVRSFDGRPPDCLEPGADYSATFDTSEGEIRVDLDEENNPVTVNNFVVLARYGYYDDTPIFRTNTGIDIIQGGGQDNTADPGYNIPDEGSGYTYEPGQLVMARTPEPNGGSAQWFFVGGRGASALDADGSYVVFGTTDEAGLQVVRDILALNEPTDPAVDPDEGAPSRPVTINSVTIEES
jgi:peptidyl-prolyl cis-trans isomerase B (cyclophilin B)